MSIPDETPATGASDPSWSDRYGDTHRWRRFVAFPAGIAPPQKVRVYQRAGHFLLNWWDPGEKRNLSERVDGDLLAALTRARAIDERVTTVRTAGAGVPGASATRTWSGATSPTSSGGPTPVRSIRRRSGDTQGPCGTTPSSPLGPKLSRDTPRPGPSIASSGSSSPRS